MGKSENKKNSLLGWTIFMWVLFLLCLGAILYLSFEDGTKAKDISEKIVGKGAAYYYDRDDLSADELTAIIYKVRQYGRIIIFFVLAILGTITIHLTFHRWFWIFRAIISVAMLMGIAVFTERYKLYLPTRHYSEQEMIYSIFGVLAGFALVSFVTLVFSLTRSIVRLSQKE